MSLSSKPAGPAGGLSFLDPRGDALPRPHGNTYWLWAGHVLAGEHPGKEGEALLPERLQLLAAHDLTFDLLVRPDQLQYSADLVGELPELTFVLDHLGNPIIGDDNSNWRAGLKELSTMPNVYAKVSGLTHNTLGKPFDRGSFDSSLESAVEFFGTDRLIFGSNWPVVNINASFGYWVRVVTDFFNKAAPNALPDILGDNAIKAYNLKIGD